MKTGGWSEAGVPVLNIVHFACCLDKVCGGEGGGESENAVPALSPSRAQEPAPQERDGHIRLKQAQAWEECPGCAAASDGGRSHPEDLYEVQVDGHVPLPEGESQYRSLCPGCRRTQGSKETISEAAEIHHIALGEPLPEWLR